MNGLELVTQVNCITVGEAGSLAIYKLFKLLKLLWAYLYESHSSPLGFISPLVVTGLGQEVSLASTG